MSAKAPQHLRPATRDWWRKVVDEYRPGDHEVMLLTTACEAWDRIAEAREVIARDGAYFVDRYGQPRPHPAVAVERENRAAFARLLRQLDLDEDEGEVDRYGRMRRLK